ncbi:MAG: T9SS type A sorting domain-containing protein [Saprospiraceae bacterium]|nr:T9SS type A sorting domain-containing protein [Saprospiraceae bacterium]
MKNLCTLLFVLLFGGLNAQITYTAADGPRPGIKLEHGQLSDLSGFDLQDYQKAGGNQNWDITGTGFEDFSTEYIPVNGLHFLSKFPGCNMAYVNVPNIDSAFNMYEYNNTGLYLVGLYQSSLAIAFDKKVTITKYPLNFGDNFQNDVTANFDAGGFPAQMAMMTNSTVDAWGTMKTEEGSFPVIKMKSVQLVEISVLGIPFGSQTLITYSWIASGFAEPVATLLFAEFEDDNGIVNDTAFTFLKDQEIVRNNDQSASSSLFKISPNPVSNEMLIDLKELDFSKADYSIINAEGKSILSGSLPKEAEFRLDISGIPSGHYLFYINLDNKRSLFDSFSKN